MSIYGLLIGICVVIGFELIRKKIPRFTILDSLLLILSALIGSRILFLLHNIEEIQSEIVKPFNLWDGGLAIYGAIFGILLAIIVIAKRKDINFFEISDPILLYLPLLQSIGRIGNYFNKELYGIPTNLPWAIEIPIENRLPGYEQYSLFHPTFAYEAILNILLFLSLKYLSKKNIKGAISGVYLIGYSLIRLLINLLRVDKEYFLLIETSDLFSGIFLGLGLLILIMISDNKWKKKLARFFSRPVMLFLIVLASIVFVTESSITTTYAYIISILTFVVPLATILLFKRLGIISDINATKREERPRLYIVMLISFLISLYITFLSGESSLITVFLVINLTFVIGFVITFFWKISYHMIWSVLSLFVIFYILQNPYTLLLVILLPFIAWSRIERKRHTLAQLIAGVVLPLICITLVLTFV